MYVHVCDVYLCHSTCVKLTQEYFVVCMVEQRTNSKPAPQSAQPVPLGFAETFPALVAVGNGLHINANQSCMTRQS